ncbi:MAG: Flp pilus assembly protein CpaB [Paracoccaceae bacterium]
MRIVFGLVLILGMGLAGFAVFLARDYIGAYQAELAAERAARAQIVQTVEVFVSTRTLRYGEKLAPADIRAVRWPVDAIPQGAFMKREEIFPNGDVVLRTVVRAMEKDEAILAIKVTGPGIEAGVSSRLAKGMRAFAIKVDVTSGVSGFLRPGDRVDVYWTGQGIGIEERGRAGDLTKLIETSVKILAIDQKADEDRNTATIARTVTVELTPYQVASLAQAQATGRLSLALVGADDTEAVEAVQVNSRDLLGIQDRQIVAEAVAPKICTVKTRRGGAILETQIECPPDS